MSLVYDLQSALRSLRRTPWFSLWVVILLALTLAANALLFTVVNAVVLRPLPFAEPDRLVWIWSTRTDRDQAFFSFPDYLDFRDQNRTLEHFAVFTAWGGNTTGPGGPERWRGVRTTANTFELLGVRAALGRALQPGDGQPGSPNAMVLTYGFWQRRFGSDPNVLGQPATLSGTTFTMVGVLPRNFLFPGTGTETEFVAALVPETDPRRNDRQTNFLRGFARLKRGVTREQAFDDFAAINARLKEMYPEANAKKTPPRFFPLHAEILGDFRAALWTLLAAAGLVLLLAGANLAALLKVRAMSREKEFAVRLALGASPSRLGSMLFAEVSTLAVAGAVVALQLTFVGLQALVRLSPTTLPRAGEIEFGAPTIVFTIFLAALLALLMGAGPARRASRALVRQGLHAEGRSATASRTKRWGLDSLVLTEVAIATLLLMATGLFLKSYAQLQNISPGFVSAGVLMLRPALPPARYADPAALQQFTENLQRELETIPGVDSAGAASAVPMAQINNRMDFEIAGRPPATKEEVLTAQNRQVSPRYFRAMQIPIIEGREFSDADTASSHRVVIVDAALARQYFPGHSPVGEHLIIEKQDNVIVGVAGEVKHFGLDDPPFTTFYQPIAQLGKTQASFTITRLHFVIRTRLEPLALAAEARRRLAHVDSDLPVTSIRAMDQFLEVWIAPRRFNLQLLGTFAAFAIVLTGLGLYSVLAAAARQRTHEIGVRLALGAQRGSIFCLMLRRGATLCVSGMILGLTAAGLVAQPVRSLLYNVRPFDTAILMGVTGLLLLVGAAASFLPAWRASRVDPLVSLRGC